MFKQLADEEVPVLYQIYNLHEKGIFYFNLDNSEFSLFNYEQEILFWVNSEFNIEEISE